MSSQNPGFPYSLAHAEMESTPKGVHPAGNIQRDIYAAAIVTLSLAVIAVALRFLARRLIRAPIWLDDWLILVALVCSNSLFIPKIIFPRSINNVRFEQAAAIGFDINIFIREFRFIQTVFPIDHPVMAK